MPEASSSFGAVASDGWLYVYGGHVVRTHSYSTEAVSGKFNRLNLADGRTWESLPDGPKLQGMNLVAHRGRVYRVGGMQPLNAPGQAQDIRSVAEVARFDPATRRWEALAPLNDARSSHDVAVVGDTLFVVGGWNLRGSQPTEWPDGMEVMDLSAATPAWRRVPQPFKRRALTATALDGKVYVLGGFDEQSQVVRRVSIYDVASAQWSVGPDLPGGTMSGFGPAACVVDGRLFVSIDDGSVYRLDGAVWQLVGKGTPRIVHR
jgi:N-acetylneuraminic acid mutarotase